MDALHQLRLPFRAIGLPLAARRGIGEHESGRDRVAGDAIPSQILADLLGQADQRMLGGGVGLDAGQARTQAGAGGDVDDAAEALVLHGRGDRLRHPESAVDIGLEQHAPVFLRHLGDRLADLAAHPAGERGFEHGIASESLQTAMDAAQRYVMTV